MKKNKKSLILLFLFVCLCQLVFPAGDSWAKQPVPVRNVIILIADGAGGAHSALTRWYKGGPLALDEIVSGGIKTYASDSIITDSASAATAYATGYKTDAGSVAMFPDKYAMPGMSLDQNDRYKPLSTVLEGAKLLGKSTGLVATVNIQHATPAGFSTHLNDRNNYIILAKQQVYQQIDVVFGGGRMYLLPKELGGKREDGLNLLDVLKSQGCEIVENTRQMKDSKAKKIWGLFADGDMSYDLDRDPFKEPGLAEMTAKALEILSANPKGFFLMVEGSKIDHAAHANDPVGVVSDMLAFDEAVKAALDFSKKDQNTLVLAFGDHGTGGMTIGNSSVSYNGFLPARLVEPLKNAKYTAQGLQKLLNPDRSNLVDILKQYYGLPDLSQEEIDALLNARSSDLAPAIGRLLSKRAGIGWTTGGHTGEDLFLYSFGPQKPTGLLDNTEIAKKVAAAFGFDLDKNTAALFVNLKDKAAELGYTMKLTPKGKTPQILLENGKTSVLLFIDTNLMYADGREIKLKSITVSAFGKAYASREVVDYMIKGKK
ncbi:MAG: alkaline phosphatase [Bacillota bacterium]